MKKLLILITVVAMVSCKSGIEQTTLISDYFKYAANNQPQAYADKYSMEALSNGAGHFIEVADTLINVRKAQNEEGREINHLALVVHHITTERAREIFESYREKFNLVGAPSPDAGIEIYTAGSYRFEVQIVGSLSIDAYEVLK